jgi:hypothetical protein
MRFPLEYEFEFISPMRSVLPLLVSILRRWTVLPSGL